MRNARGLSEGKKESPHTEENRKRGYESKFTGEMVARSPTKRKEIMILLFYSFLTVNLVASAIFMCVWLFQLTKELVKIK